jgi:spore germination protein GerM
MKTKPTIGSEPSAVHYGDAGNKRPDKSTGSTVFKNNNAAMHHDEQIVEGAQASNLIINQPKKNNMKNSDNNSKNKTGSKLNSAEDATAKLKGLEKEADKTRTKSAGSQSNSSDRHNTGRGGGK